MSFEKVLVANRGEIAIRVIRACKELGLKTVAVYSEADDTSLHIRMADEAYCIGSASPADSYLNILNIISTAQVSGADAIHPGYGFLAENAKFAEICEQYRLKFIGPSAHVIQTMGDKAKARETIGNIAPIVPGSNILETLPQALKAAEELEYPVMVKAAAGGGGKGMRIIQNPQQLENLWPIVQAEAKGSFGDYRLYLEKYLLSPKHIEFQILADNYGNVIHLGERDCSVQRRNQKLIEESPSIVLTQELRKEIGSVSVKCAKMVGYTGAGTMEFLYDQEKKKYYFLEMNTRIQVEHAVTEMVTGVDLVKEQIRVAMGEKLSFHQKDITIRGHSIECRINAEDPDRFFSPSSGKITRFTLPGGPGIRIDTYMQAGMYVNPYYDSMLAKLVSWGIDRKEAIARMLRALGEFEIFGIKTVIPFHIKSLEHPIFVEGRMGTDFIERAFKD
jgi:acetyl-CoA carboxylase biotin carboxylase subunit